jgi:hypothetical protein
LFYKRFSTRRIGTNIFCFDNFNSGDFDANEYKEWLMFKNISKEKMFGFTIGGFAPLRKTTLIPVKKNFFLENIIN